MRSEVVSASGDEDLLMTIGLCIERKCVGGSFGLNSAKEANTALFDRYMCLYNTAYAMRIL